MKKTLKYLHTPLNYHNRSLLLIDTLFNTFFILSLLPFFSFIFDLVLDLSNQSYLTIENLKSFLTSLPAVLFILLLIFSIMIFFYIKLSSMVFYCNSFEMLARPYLPRILYFGLRNTWQKLKSCNVGLLVFMFPFYVMTNLPVIIGMTLFMDFEFIPDQKIELLLKVLAALVITVICAISFPCIFAVYDCILKKRSFSQGLACAKPLLKGRKRKTLLAVAAYNLLLLFGFFLFYYFVLLLTSVAVYLFSARANVISVFLSAYPKISIYATLLFGIFTFSLNVNLTFSLFYTYADLKK